MKKLITSITIRMRQDWFSGLRIIYLAVQQIMQVRKGYWTIWYLLGRGANATRYNRAGVGVIRKYFPCQFQPV